MTEKRMRAAHVFCEHFYGNTQKPFIRLALRTQARVLDAMLAFADEQVKAERARCAKVCEDVADEYQQSDDMKWPELKSDAETGARSCVYRIESLKD